ncbi:MAG: DNA topoisomerase I [Halofilum sp. (in: g-proteobacteria)]|nr:DNA topoisomerase I [Halofilum sp. (in: g-proteobacteria)]
MAKNLVIVESPAKGKTIKKYLGPDYEVMASYGHVRDLVPKTGAVDPDNGFAMHYQVIERNERHIQAIERALKKAERLVLATDPDREGEAISWHLTEELRARGRLDGKAVDRVVFHEVTKRAIQEAANDPRGISMDLVNAQQARRALDYLVGFNLSPLLWKKIRQGLSAGRVQSPALRMITEREAEIEAFVPQEYWSVEAALSKDDEPVTAKLVRLDGKKFEQFTLTDGDSAAAARRRLLAAANGTLHARSVEKKQRKRNPAPPFTTSTLQQEASRKLGFSASRTMRVAQQLYEGIDTGEGQVGLITYMRTDSVTLANDALDELRDLIAERFGAENLPEKARRYKTKSKNAQEAHEAIRPTSARRHPDSLRRHLSSDQQRLYELIWKRTVACQMIHATMDTVAIELVAESEVKAEKPRDAFRATGSVVRHPGFMAVYREDRDDSKSDPDAERRLPEIAEGERLPLHDIHLDQHFTEPPPRYTEASLVKALEEYGIGRPSTYASIISTLQDREYVEIESRRFFPTDVGRVVARFLSEHFSQYVDYEFTARLEDELDAVARGEEDWVPLLERFWKPLKERIEDKEANVTRAEAVQARQLGTDPKSGRPVSARMGRYGPLIQIGTVEDDEKPRFASLRPGQKLDTITLEEALPLFNLPRDLGETEDGEEMQANIGRFGPYVRFGDRFVSIPRDEDPYTITKARARELVREKKIADANRIINTFETEDGTRIQVLNGRYGPYVTDRNKNASVPKDEEPAELTLERCLELIAAAPERRRGRKKAAAKKKAAAATAGKKKAAKKKSKARAKKKAGKKKSAKKKARGKKAAKKATAKKRTAAPASGSTDAGGGTAAAAPRTSAGPRD